MNYVCIFDGCRNLTREVLCPKHRAEEESGEAHRCSPWCLTHTVTEDE